MYSPLHLARTKQETNSIELIPQLVIKLPPFYGIQRFITCSQEAITWPYPEPSNFSLFITIFKIHFNIILPSLPMSSKWYLSFSCPNQIPVYFSSSKYLPHVPTAVDNLAVADSYWHWFLKRQPSLASLMPYGTAANMLCFDVCCCGLYFIYSSTAWLTLQVW